MANKKITELTELTATNIANNDVLAIVDVGGDETKKVSISSLRDIFDDNVSIDTAKIVYGLTGANTNISTLSVNTLPLIGGTVTGPMVTYSINSSSNVSIAQSLAIGYVDHRIPQANLDVKDNVYIGGATTISGTLTLGSALTGGQGGTGATSLTDGGVLLGSGTGAITAMGVLGDGEIIVGDGTTDPVAESGATLRTSVGVGTGDTPQFYGANVSGNAKISRGISVGYVSKVPGANLDVNGNAYISTDLRLGQDATIVRDASIGRNLIVSGNLTVKGNNFIVHANNLVVDDPIIALAANLKSSQSPADDTGILLNRGSKSNVFAGYDESSNSYVIAYTPTTANSSPIDIGSYSTTRVGALTADSLTLSTALPVGQGGTGATSLTDGGVLLGSGTGAVTAMGVLSDGQMIVGDGSTDPVAESGATLRTSIGVGTGNTPIFYGANVTGNVSVQRNIAIGYANDQVPQANLDVNGNVHISGTTTLDTALTVASGGTGATSLTDGGVLLGSGTGAITALGVLSDGEVIVGDGSTDPVAESGDTLRTSIGVGSTASGTVMQIYSANTTGNVRVARNLAVGYVNSKVPGANLSVNGNAYISGATTIGGALSFGSLASTLGVGSGGTGATSFTNGGILFGSGSSAITASPVLTDGVMLVGDGTTDPALEGNTTLRTSIGIGTGNTPQFYGANVSGNASINRSMAIGYTDGRVPQANLDVKGNVVMSSTLAVTGTITSGGSALQTEGDVLAYAIALG